MAYPDLRTTKEKELSHFSSSFLSPRSVVVLLRTITKERAIFEGKYCRP